MTTLERMLLVAPIRLLHVSATGLYRCEWSVNHVDDKHAIGTGYTPFNALVAAWNDAVTRGWVKP